MQAATADFTAILEEAFRAEAAAAFMPKVVTAVLLLAVLLVPAWLLHRFFQKRGLSLPKSVLLVYAIFYGGVALFQYGVVRNARTVRNAALAEIPNKAKQASGLVQRLLADSTGTAVPTESGTYLALAGDQVFLPKPVADALQKALITKNLRLP